MKFYTGVGSRETPPEILEMMTKLGERDWPLQVGPSVQVPPKEPTLLSSWVGINGGLHRRLGRVNHMPSYICHGMGTRSTTVTVALVRTSCQTWIIPSYTWWPKVLLCRCTRTGLPVSVEPVLCTQGTFIRC